MVDDAHGLGVWARPAAARSSTFGLDAEDVPVLIGTLGKAFGSFGAFVAGRRRLIELLIQTARTYIYTTALPQPVAAATRAALHVAQAEGWRRERVLALTARFRARAPPRPACRSAPPARPSSRSCSEAPPPRSRRSAALQAAGLWVVAIRPPTVPPGAARLRVTLSAAHTEAQVDELVVQLARVCAGAERDVSALHFEVQRPRPGSGAAARLGPEPRVWDELARALARRFRVIAIDLPGHGRSDWDPRAATPAAQAWRVHETLAPLTQRYALLGWSLGGTVRARSRRRHARAHRAPGAGRHDTQVSRRARLALRHGAGAAARLDDALQANCGRDAAVDEFLALRCAAARRARRPGCSSDAARRAGAYTAPRTRKRSRNGLERLRDGDLRAALPLVRVPALVIAGRHDRITRAAASRALAARARRGPLRRIRRRRARARSCRTRSGSRKLLTEFLRA